MTKADKEGQRKAPILRFKGFTDDWEQRKLLKVCKKEDNKRIPIKEQERKEGNTPYFGANGIQGYIDGYTHDGTNILIAEDGANNIRNYPIKLITGKIWVNNHAHVLKVSTKTNNGNFLVGAIKKINFYRYLVGSSRYKLTAESLNQVKIKIAKQSEQEKIGELFKNIEELLTLYERKLKLLSQVKKYFLDNLFAEKEYPNLRFRGFTDAWEQRKPSDYLKESKIPGGNGEGTKKLTVKLWGKGVTKKETIYQGSSNTQYYIRKSGQLIYGKLDFLHAAFGLVPKELDGYESTIDSPSFDVLHGDSEFLLNYFLRKDFYLKNGKRANGSRKAKRINQKTFLNMIIYCPSQIEQSKISGILSKINNLITLYENKQQHLTEIKNILLNTMFI